MEAVGQLTGGIAHDFNNMLAVVVGGLDLARRRLHGPAARSMFHLDNAMEGATRAAALTRRLLAFARAEPLLPERRRRRRAGRRHARAGRPRDRRADHRPHQLAADAWPMLADPPQLENAILNLAVNARDAMDGAGDADASAIDNVTLAGRGRRHPRRRLCPHRVADTGCGMTAEDLDRVFEPFFTTKAVGKGTGLGLCQIFAFARQSGGDVGIESELGKGTTVSLYLPRTAAAASSVRPHPADAARSDGRS